MLFVWSQTLYPRGRTGIDKQEKKRYKGYEGESEERIEARALTPDGSTAGDAERCALQESLGEPRHTSLVLTVPL